MDTDLIRYFDGRRVLDIVGLNDRLRDKEPQFRCEKCSKKKTAELRDRGIEV